MAMSTNNASFATLKNCDMSLYIPRVDTRSVPSRSGTSGASFEDVVKDFIAKQFHYQQIGQPSRVDLLEKKTPDGWTFYVAFVHFDRWYETHAAKELLAAINDPGKKAKLHFNERWYWIVNENKKPLTADVVDLHRVIREQQADIDDLTSQLSKMTTGPQPPSGVPPPRPPSGLPPPRPPSGLPPPRPPSGLPPPRPPSGLPPPPSCFPPLTPLGSSPQAGLPPPPIKSAPMKRARTDAAGFKSSKKVLFGSFSELSAYIADEPEGALEPEGAQESERHSMSLEDHSTLVSTPLPLLTDMPVLTRSTSVASKLRMKRSISDAKSISMAKKPVVNWGDSDTEEEDDNTMDEDVKKPEPLDLNPEHENSEDDDSSMDEDNDLTKPKLERSVADADTYLLVNGKDDEDDSSMDEDTPEVTLSLDKLPLMTRMSTESAEEELADEEPAEEEDLEATD